MANSKYLLPVCHGGKEETTFAVNGIKKIISCAKSRVDGELHHKLQNIIDADGGSATIVFQKVVTVLTHQKRKLSE